jgi:hypothetical protein
MDTLVSLPGLTVSPYSRVVVRFEISADINITAFAARQRANRFLIMQVGDQLGAMQPELVVGATIHWRVPVQFAPSRLGPLGIVGHLLVDAQTGEVSIGDGRTMEDFVANAEFLYERATHSAGA